MAMRSIWDPQPVSLAHVYCGASWLCITHTAVYYSAGSTQLIA